MEDIFANLRTNSPQQEVAQTSAARMLQNEQDNDEQQIVHGSYAFEKMMLTYVQNGQAEKLRDALSGGINIKAGEMAKDELRQAKNAGICGATVASRAAIEGGLDSTVAFGLSDLYIQKFEALKDFGSIAQLTNDMFIDFAQRVQLVKYGAAEDAYFFKECARYIAAHITSALSTSVVANALHISRSYLCAKFKAETGTTLSRYIQQEKAQEAKRLLRHTDKSLSQIAMHLAYSSQSHFQNAFKEATGETPMRYRRGRY